FSHRAQERDDNLLFVRDQLLRRMSDPGPLLSLYGQARRGESVPDDERDPLTGVLRLSGVTRVEDGALRVRNRIYERVFDSGWVARHMPDAELERQRAANLRLRTLLARSQVDKGRMMLRENDTDGLLYLAQARETADGMGKFADGIAEEWALWHWQLDGRLMQVFGHDDEVTAMGFSPDGRLFITGSADGNAQLWDTDTGERQGKPLAHGSRVGRDPRWVRVSPTSSLVCFSPDGRLLAVGGEDSRISVWNAETADLHLRLELDEPRTLDQMTITPDGNLVAYADTLGRRSVWRWDLRDGSVLVDGALLPHDAEGTGILTRDGSNMLVFDNDIGLAVIDAATAEVQWQIDRFGPLTSAVWSDSFIAAGTFVANVVVVYDWQGRPVHEFSTDVFSDTAKLGSDPAHVEITPDGRSFLSVTHRGLKLWDLTTGEARGEPILHEGWIVYRSFSADSRLLAGAFGSTVLVWDVETGEQVIEPIRLPNPVKGLMFHPTDPRTLAVQSVDRSVRLWNVGPAPLYSTLTTYPGPPEATNFSNGMVAFSAADPLVAACSARHPEVVVCNVETGETHCGPLVHTVAPNPAPAPWPPMPNAVAFSPDGRRLAVANGTHGIYLWDIHAATLAVPVQECAPASLAFSP
ncbi:MAG: PQQ-binding-like beta-propeller repeat protein, partial [Candidatus Poribacteria bacterium]